MTTLNRTNLPSSLKTYFAANVIASQGKYGAVTELCSAFEVSKPTYYKVKETAEQILDNHFSKQEVNPTVEVSSNLLHRAIVALHIASPNSISAIEDLLPIIYPGIKMSYGSIWQICHEAEIKAALHNKMEDLSQIKNIALDELFSQGEPVLGGVDLDSGYVFSLALTKSRGGDDWSSELLETKRKNMDVEISVQDAAQGIRAGLSKIFLNAEQREDCFHVLYCMNNVTNSLERVAYGKIQAEADLIEKLNKTRSKQVHQKRSLESRLRSIRNKVARAIKHYDVFNRALILVREAIDFCSPLDLTTRDAK